MSVQAGGKAGDHEWKPIEKGRGYCSCEFGLNISFFLSREEWQAHLTFMRAEEAPKPVVSSAHFPRITKHDLEVVVEAMDKLREALRVEEEAKPPAVLDSEWGGDNGLPAASPSVDGLEAQVGKLLADGAGTTRFATFIRTRDRELVEKLEGVCEQAEAMIDELPDGEYKGLGGLRIKIREARAVLAARKQ